MAKDKKVRSPESRELRAASRDAMLERIAKLEGPNSFTDVVHMPSDLAAAIITNRPELMRAVRPRELSVEECEMLYNLIATLIETNAALRDHANEVALMAKNMLGGFKTIATIGQQITNFANFRLPLEGEDLE